VAAAPDAAEKIGELDATQARNHSTYLQQADDACRQQHFHQQTL
jgi:hypothetical protein